MEGICGKNLKHFSRAKNYRKKIIYTHKKAISAQSFIQLLTLSEKNCF